jgi:glycosyltransferase involved in cell wall biosynthesis
MTIVVYNALHLRPGHEDGGATFTLNVVPALVRARPDVRLVALVRAGEHRLDNTGAERVSVRVGGGAKRVAAELFAVDRLLRRVSADVLVSPHESLPPRFGGRVVVVAQNLVYQCGGASATFGGASIRTRLKTRLQFGYYRARSARAYSRADSVVCVSTHTRDVLVESGGLASGKAVVALEGADSVLLPSTAGDATKIPELLLCVSTFAPYKNHLALLEALVALRQRRPGATLVTVGGDWRGFRAVVERRIASLGLESAVRVLPPTTGSALGHLYESSALLVHPSSCESFGLPVVEAMRYGLPVVAARRSSLPEVAGDAAVLVDPDDPATFSMAIDDLLGDEGRRAELVERGHARASSLTWDGFAQALGARV